MPSTNPASEAMVVRARIGASTRAVRITAAAKPANTAVAATAAAKRRPALGREEQDDPGPEGDGDPGKQPALLDLLREAGPQELRDLLERGTPVAGAAEGRAGKRGRDRASRARPCSAARLPGPGHCIASSHARYAC